MGRGVSAIRSQLALQRELFPSCTQTLSGDLVQHQESSSSTETYACLRVEALSLLTRLKRELPLWTEQDVEALVKVVSGRQIPLAHLLHLEALIQELMLDAASL